MNRLIVSVSLAIAAGLAIPLMPSCAAFNKAVPLIEPAGACIATQLLEGGATDPLQIVAACAGVTIDDVIAVIEALMAQAATASPALVRLADMHSKALVAKAAKK